MSRRSPRAAVKEALTDLRADISWRFGFSRPVPGAAGSLTVLTFHRVIPEGDIAGYPFPELGVTPRELDGCLRYVNQHYDVGLLSTQFERLQAGVAGDRPLLAITFDDGQWDNCSFGAEVLEKNGLRATFYIPVHSVDSGDPLWHEQVGYAVRSQQLSGRESATLTSLSLQACTPGQVCEALKQLSSAGRQDFIATLMRETRAVIPAWNRMMSWDDVRNLHRQGHEIGSHSVTHDLLPDQGQSQVDLEIRESKSRIETITGAPVRSFCYPNGSYDDRAIRTVRESGYENAVTTKPGINMPGESPYEIKRIHVASRNLANRNGGNSWQRLAFTLARTVPRRPPPPPSASASRPPG